MDRLTTREAIRKICGKLSATGLLFSLTCILLLGAAQAQAQSADRNWVALNIFDTFYPMPASASFPENLSDLETIYQVYTARQTEQQLAGVFGAKPSPFGSRSREGHFLIWIHLSDEFLKTHPIDRNAIGTDKFLFPDRNNDIFTAWSGDVNLVAFLTQGVKGLGTPLKDSKGVLSGNFQNFKKDIAPLGDADYEGGWYMSDEQSQKILSSFQSYPGIQKGYSFMSFAKDKPNAPYEPANAQLVNGYNCGDFAFYALTTAGVVSKDVAESLKIQFWYPEHYFDEALPLKGVGARGAAWIAKNPGVTSLPSNIMITLAWYDLLFNPFGLEFFDKQKIVTDLVENQPKLTYARIWDQYHVIEWLKTHSDFRAKGIASEILPALNAGSPITSPERTIAPTAHNRYTMTADFRMRQRRGDRFTRRKLKKAGIPEGQALTEFQNYYNLLKKNP